eukprot:CAMPEP_0114489462 /NCGR_PEP_ID=MMETSP0109-20121206/1904_1 /TAXON_ID=29199 /ORGANISM="Chlorarachnion reptans, Strain CCCM449" /LENGTH=148 /DNA_ID=CAMNT_0001665979 /DNA_START=585 /DNA_END=1031 /DNA_ORIENTATION=-
MLQALTNVGQPDYLFIDSYHNREFAHFFQKNIMSKMKPGSLVSVHDAWHDQSYTDDAKGRDLKCHPAHEPTMEGLQQLVWIAFSGRARNVFCMSPTAKFPFHTMACMARETYLDPKTTSVNEGLHPFDPQSGCGPEQATIFFELRSPQ